jgi:hypothetical protein
MIVLKMFDGLVDGATSAPMGWPLRFHDRNATFCFFV